MARSTPLRLKKLLTALEQGHTQAEAIEIAGISRSTFFDLKKRDEGFAEDVAQARAKDDGTTPVGADLTTAQIKAFSRALYKTGNIRTAALAAKVDMYPDRLRPADFTRHQRELARDFFVAMEAPEPKPEPTPTEIAQQALDGWLVGNPWPEDIDPAELRRLSPRAADDYETAAMLRAADDAAGA